MKNIIDLSSDIEHKADIIDKIVAKAQRIVANKLCNDIKSLAPTKTGEYRDSIKVSPTTIENNVIKTFVGTDFTVGPTKWTGGVLYNLGYLLEHGTYEHAIPNAFGYGFYYGFTDMHGRFHKGTLDPDWHPGTIAQPHFSIALEKNKKFYKDKIKEVWRQE